MELPLYSFKEFLQQHPEHGNAELERPLRSTVSEYYKAYIQKVGIQSNFSNYTTVTGIYHLKDLENHCCCSMIPHQRQGKSRARTSLGGASSSSSTQHNPKIHDQGTGAPCRTCAQFRYAVLGYVESTTANGDKSDNVAKIRTRFLIRCKTVILATGTFDQPKKLPAASIHPCAPSAGATIQQTFHDTRQLEEWMARNGAAMDTKTESTLAVSSEVSPPPSPSLISALPSTDSTLSEPESSESSTALAPELVSVPMAPPVLPPVNRASTRSPAPRSSAHLPIVIVGTGLSAADAILLIQEKQPWRRIIHIYKHFSASEPSPLKRCHRDVYPEYASVWVRMKKSATLKNSVLSYCPSPSPSSTSTSTSSPSPRHCNLFGDAVSANTCEQCKVLSMSHQAESNQQPPPLCTACSYKGLPDASVSSWDPVTGKIVIILSHGVVIQERVAAVGVFIGKQVHMGFLKGSLAQEMLSTSGGRPTGVTDRVLKGTSSGGAKIQLGPRNRLGQRRDSSNSDLMVDIPTPPCTPPRSPVLRPRYGTTLGWQKLVFQAATQGLSLLKREHQQRQERQQLGNTNEKNKPQLTLEEQGVETCINNDNGADVEMEAAEEEGADSDDAAVADDYKEDDSQVLTLLRPLVSDLYSFRIIPTGVASDNSGSSRGTMTAISSVTGSSSTEMTPIVLPMKPKRCTRLPCYPIRQSNTTAAPSSTSCVSDGSDESKTGQSVSQVDGLLLLDHGSDKNRDQEQDPEVDAAGEGKEGSKGATVQSSRLIMSSCISMPCSPLLGCRRMCSELGVPPLLTLCAAVTTTITALAPEGDSNTVTETLITPMEMDGEGTSALLVTVSTATGEKQRVVIMEEHEQAKVGGGDEAEEEEEEEEEVVPPLMDQSIYAAGAITGSKFVRYVLGNGVAIVADILRSEASCMAS
ncbi:hypothetical protein BGX31_002168 [Mortierella sp. GBA43]|nr:hypothetical protein BGX31_002168 [Mortierella sp. GBA43]